MPGSEPGVGEDKTQRPRPATRSMFRHFSPLQTRWSDNDNYGHINNVVYYAYFDTVVNDYLISRGALDVAHGAVIGLVVETGCHYFAAAAFPETLEAGLRVAQIGNSSVRYEIAIFRGADDAAIAQGHFVHVYVNRLTRRPAPLPDNLRAAAAALQPA
ncbi:MAG TPA: thioesterase family protein [Usitatibacteraceae bacterium]